MAIIPETLFPGQIDPADAEYPLGKARNVSAPGDGLGTPLTKDVYNDLWGFLQALLADASIPADGFPDKVGASQYLTAMKATTGAKGFVHATLAPAVTDDVDDGAEKLSLWLKEDTESIYICLDPAVGAAVWLLLHTESGASEVTIGAPVTSVTEAIGVTSKTVKVSLRDVTVSATGKVLLVFRAASSDKVVRFNITDLYGVSISGTADQTSASAGITADIIFDRTGAVKVVAVTKLGGMSDATKTLRSDTTNPSPNAPILSTNVGGTSVTDGYTSAIQSAVDVDEIRVEATAGNLTGGTISITEG